MHILEQRSTNSHEGAGTSSSDSDALYHIVRRLEGIRISALHGSGHDYPLPPSNYQITSTHYNRPPFHQFDDELDAYPAHIFETAIQCGSQCLATRTPFYALWHQVLAYWFPLSAGFKVEKDWQPSFLDPYLQQPLVSMAVLYQEQPIVLLYLDESRDHLNGLSQRSLRAAGNRAFDTISIWSGQPAICVIAAMDTKWSSFIRPTEMTSSMVDEMIGHDWYGDFTDEVLSLESYQALKQYFNILKASLR